MADVCYGLRKQGQQAHFEWSEHVHIFLYIFLLFSILYTYPPHPHSDSKASVYHPVFYMLSSLHEKGPSLWQFCICHL